MIIVAYTDGSCFLEVPDVTLTDPEVPAIATTTIIPESECDADDGSIQIFSTGGVAPVQYSIDGGTTFFVGDPGQPSKLFEDLAPGTYTIQVVGSGGTCLSPTQDVIVPAKSAVTVDNVVTTNPSDCGATDGSITLITSGGDGTIMYSLNGGTAQTSSTFSSLGAGDYVITITNGDGTCPVTQNVTLFNPAGPTIDGIIALDEGTCETNTGSITISASGGDTGSPYEYSFDGGTMWDTNASMTGLTPGTYSVSVRNGNNTCPAEFQDVVIAEGPCDCDDIVATGTDICDYLAANPGSALEDLDCDGGGISNIDECDPPGGETPSNPNDPCDDPRPAGTDLCDLINAGGEMSVIGMADCDMDGLTNWEECNPPNNEPPTNPEDPCSNNYTTGQQVCDAITAGATGLAMSDCDGGGITDGDECTPPGGGTPTDPLDPCDDMNPAGTDLCDLINAAGEMSALGMADCDMDGLTNWEECNPPNNEPPTNPEDPCSNNYTTGQQVCDAITAGATGLAMSDCDGGGITDGDECTPPGGGTPTDPLDPCDDMNPAGTDLCDLINAAGETSALGMADCDMDGLTNWEECNPPNNEPPTNPEDPCSNNYTTGDQVCDAITAGATGLAMSDCDGGGITDGDECTPPGGGTPTDPLDPCDDMNPAGTDLCDLINAAGEMSALGMADCDMDGLTNWEECNPPNNEPPTNPEDPCSNNYTTGQQVCDAITAGATGLAMSDCDGGGITDGDECTPPGGGTPTDPLDPCDDMNPAGTDLCDLINAAGEMSALGMADCDMDGLTNWEECNPPNNEPPTNPEDPCSNNYTTGDQVCDAITAGATGLAMSDCDGGGITDGDECTPPGGGTPTDPLDPCDDMNPAGTDLCDLINAAGEMSALGMADCDMDGLTNWEECNPPNNEPPTNPEDPCSNNYTTGQQVCDAITAGATGLAMSDCDGGGITDGDECTPPGGGTPTDPLDPCDDMNPAGTSMCDLVLADPTGMLAMADCDGDGFTNLEECDPPNGPPSNPEDPCSIPEVPGMDLCDAVNAAGEASAIGMADCDMDGTNNWDECNPPIGVPPTNPEDPCSNPYTSGAQVCAVIATGMAPGLAASDCDGGGITDGEECVPPGGGTPTDPLDPCDDMNPAGTDLCDLIDAAGETSALGMADCDMDGVDNWTECNPPPGTPPTNPEDPCDNPYTTGQQVCDAIDGGATGLEGVDCDGGGINDDDECDDNTDPLDPCDDMRDMSMTLCEQVLADPTSALALNDCDGDGFTNLEECDPPNGPPSNPEDPCSIPEVPGMDLCDAVNAAGEMSALGMADCDMDGLTNWEECNPPNNEPPTNPEDPCSNNYTTGQQVCDAITAGATGLAMSDCDGGGITDGDECTPPGGGTPTDPLDPCDDMNPAGTDLCDLINAAGETSALGMADCDMDGLTNWEECNPPNNEPPTNPEDPCSNNYTTGQQVCDAITAGATGLAMSDCDGGGITDGDECTPPGGGTPTDPLDPCDDMNPAGTDLCDLINAAGETSALGMADCDMDGLTNWEECNPPNNEPPTNPEDPCSNNYTTGDQVCDAITAGATGLAMSDCDGGGITDGDECTPPGGGTPTDPLDPCDDMNPAGTDLCDLINAAGETSALGMADCDMDGLTNWEECNPPNNEPPTNPEDPCSNNYTTGQQVCDAITAGATGLAMSDCDGGGITDGDECTPPGGGTPTDPLDPCDDMNPAGTDLCDLINAAGETSALGMADCDMDGLTNWEECNPPNNEPPTNPEDPCSNNYTTGDQVCDAITAGATGLAMSDCDGGGITDGDECTPPGGGTPTDPLDPCDDMNPAGTDLCDLINAAGETSALGMADCDMDGLTNWEECNPPNNEPPTNPEDPCSNNYTTGQQVCDAITAGATGLAMSDCDGGGITDGDECTPPGGGTPTNPLDPCDDMNPAGTDLCDLINAAGETSALGMADCDMDGLTNWEECNPPNNEPPTNPEDPCSNNYTTGDQVCDAITAGATGLAMSDCDGGGITDGDECTPPGGGTPTDPLDPCDDMNPAGTSMCDLVLADPTGMLAMADCDGDGFTNLEECDPPNGPPSNPEDPCSIPEVPGMDLCDAVNAAGEASAIGMADCDMDGTNNWDECNPPIGVPPTNPEDPCSNPYTSGAQVCAVIATGMAPGLAASDCDGGGITDGEECVPPGGGTPTDPLDPCDDMNPAGTDLCDLIDAAGETSALGMADCDMDGVDNWTECNPPPGTPPTNPEDPCDNPYTTGQQVCDAIDGGATGLEGVDCDGGGINDDDECDDNTDPLDPCDDMRDMSMTLCEQVLADPTSALALNDCDGDGFTNLEECDPPNGPPSNPEDPCSIPEVPGMDLCDAVNAAGETSAIGMADCDMDGLTNWEECNPPNNEPPTNPEDPCSNNYTTGDQVCDAITAGATGLAMSDCDGGGITDGDECTPPGGGTPTNPLDPCDDMNPAGTDLCDLINAAGEMSALGMADCDMDGLTNWEECNPPNNEPPTNPEDPCSNNYTTGQQVCDAITAGATGLAMSDCDGGGITDGDECTPPGGGTPTDPLDPCDDMNPAGTDLCDLINAAGEMSALGMADCDMDGLTNWEECNPPNNEPPTNPEDPCSNNYTTGDQVCDAITAGATGLAMSDCDGGGITDGDECNPPNGDPPTNPLDPCDDMNPAGTDICDLVTADPTGMLAMADCDGDGFTNLEECDPPNGPPSNPEDPCSIPEVPGMDLCDAVNSAGETSAIGMADCDMDGTSNWDECNPPIGVPPTNPEDPCSNPYTSGAQVCSVIATGMAPGLAASDCDGGGITDGDECVPPGGGTPTDPLDPCDDMNPAGTDLCDLIDAAGETSALGMADCDMDGVSNWEECNPLPGTPPTNPEDPCDNPYTTGQQVCDAIDGGATGLEGVDCDMGGVNDDDECEDMTDPLDPCDDMRPNGETVCDAVAAAGPNSIIGMADCDGDGFTNAEECDPPNGPPSNPEDPCSIPEVPGMDLCDAVNAAGEMSAIGMADCDMDGLTNWEECNPPNNEPPTNPEDPCSNNYTTGQQVCDAITAGATGLAMSDCDGGGITDGDECTPPGGGTPTDPLDPCDDMNPAGTDLCDLINAAGEMSALGMADCDMDGLTNWEECNPPNNEPPTNPEDPCSNNYTTGQQVCDAITAGATGLAMSDCDGGGITDGDECTPPGGGTPTDPLDPCDDMNPAGTDLCDLINAAGEMSALGMADCDMDGLTNWEECNPPNNEPPTNPEDPCSNNYTTGDQVCDAITAGATGLAMSDCDGGGITDGDECTPPGGGTPTNPLDPCDDMLPAGTSMCDLVLADPNGMLAMADCDDDGFTNIEECDPPNGPPSNPEDPCSIPEVMGMDLCDAINAAGETSALGMADCDMDGITNWDECNPPNNEPPTNPEDPCSNSYTTGDEVCDAIANGATGLAAADCDGGGITDGDECTPPGGGTPTNPLDPCDDPGLTGDDICASIDMLGVDSPFWGLDCDNGGVPNEIECANGGDPLMAEDDCDSAGDDDFDLCAYVIANPDSDLALADCDGGGVPNITECINGGDPLLSVDDCESADDPSFNLCEYVLANPTSTLALADCDDGGITNIVECLAGGNPLDPTDDINPRPDENVTYVDVPVTGDLSTNDMNIPDGSTYGDPVPIPGNPTTDLPMVDENGEYVFETDLPGVYNFQVPVETPDGMVILVDLVITVLDSEIENNVPVVNVDIATTPFETEVTLSTLSNDYPGNPGTPLDPATVVVTIMPPNGMTSVDPLTGDITYIPNDGFVGTDTLTYQVMDENGNVSTAQQIITVLPPDAGNTTTAADDNTTTPYETPVMGNVSTNDSDAEGDNQTVIPQLVTVPEGMLILFPDGSYTFTPADGFSGPVDFPYEVIDGQGASDMATLHILVQPIPIATISGEAWKDENGNGIQEAAEAPIQGLVAVLEDCDGNFIDAAVTNADGEYTFDDVPVGMVRVRFDNSSLPAGCVFTQQDVGDDTTDSDADQFGNGPCIEIMEDEDVSNYSAGLAPTAGVTGFVWNDMDADGNQDSEAGLEGVTVTLYYADGTEYGTTTTDENGEYSFDNIPVGDYYVEFTDPDGNTLSPPNATGNDNNDSDATENGDGTSSSAVFSVSAGNPAQIDAGYYECAQIGETVWYDVNTNNQEDSNENGLNGMVVNLYTADGTLYDSAITGHKPGTPSDDGYYKFCVPPGSYYVEVVLPPQGLVPAQPNVGSDATDSDITNANGFGTTNTFTVTSGQDMCDIGAGYYPMAEVGNFVWHDADQNGIQDAGEQPLENVMVQVFDESNQMISETVTDEQGNYNVDYLGQTQYYFKFTPPNGFGATTANATVDEYDSDVTHAYGANTTNLYSLQSGQVVTHVDAGMALGVLPIEWLSVSADNRGDHNLVKWATASEINSDYYEIERRLESESDYRSIAKEEAVGFSLERTDYSYEDYELSATGNYYYRIKQVDTDGTVDYSDIVVVTIDRKEAQLSLYPNPAIDMAVLTITLDEDTDVTMSIFNADGKLIRSDLNVEQVSPGQYEKRIALDDLLPGVYRIKLQANDRVWNRDLIIVK